MTQCCGAGGAEIILRPGAGADEEKLIYVYFYLYGTTAEL